MEAGLLQKPSKVYLSRVGVRGEVSSKWLLGDKPVMSSGPGKNRFETRRVHGFTSVDGDDRWMGY